MFSIPDETQISYLYSKVIFTLVQRSLLSQKQNERSLKEYFFLELT